MDWQPIETAPKDGAVFLVYLPDGRPGGRKDDRVWLCTWDSYTDAQSGLFPGWIQPLNVVKSGSQPVYRLNPTHWMPLPEPPK
jgi:hypothetical protein